MKQGGDISRLEALAAQSPGEVAAWVDLALAHRQAQNMDEALQAFQRAASLAPGDPGLAQAVAQLCFETARPAADQFEVLHAANPDDLDLIKGLAGALGAEGRAAEAEALLGQAVASRPAWVEGHLLLSTLRTTAFGDPDFARSFADAAPRVTETPAVYLGWCQSLAAAKRWDSARKVALEGLKRFALYPALTSMVVVAASEMGEGAGDDRLFDRVPGHDDPGLDLCHVRHCLRAGMAEKAAEICRSRLGGPFANVFWPYLSTAWRLIGDEAAAWLDGSPPFVATMDIGYSSQELDALAEALRSMHTLQAPYMEQSVRGGTQTDRQLFFRSHPEIRKVRAAVERAVADYLTRLPPRDPRHPLLAYPRDEILFEGSWSVRLGAQGFHTRHTHPRGWISSALYVALPSAADLGPAPGGWFSYGAPPPELGLDLAAYGQVEPRPGRLVLFPSTLWHGTEPFQDGERLTIAFDVKIPRLAP